jgi:outer membrane protein assembly factor BamD (BamD/ComL family)
MYVMVSLVLLVLIVVFFLGPLWGLTLDIGNHGVSIVQRQTPDKLLEKAEGLFARAKYADAVKKYEDLLEKFPDSYDTTAQAKIAMSYALMGNCDAAEREYDKLLKDYPLKPEQKNEISLNKQNCEAHKNADTKCCTSFESDSTCAWFINSCDLTAQCGGCFG